jgi:hypothetical protein
VVVRVKRVAVLSVLALAACQQSAPPSSGVGFSDYGNYQMAQLERDRVLTGQAPLIPPVGAAPAVAGAPLSAIPAAPVATATTAAPVPARDNPGISDEQNFDAVSARETIQSDAERLAQLRAEYQVVQPEALPEREGDTGPNIVAFALETTNAVGQPVYRRSGFRAEARFESACARYTSPDEAQRAFLERGGPEDDRLGVDPDGDGFACYWDPSPFRAARGSG